MEYDIRKRLHVLFASEVHISLAYLFGSQVTGDVGPMSNYDFGILVDSGADLASLRASLMHEITRVVGTDHVDLVILNHAPLDLAHAIVVEGVILYQRDTAIRVEYEAEVMSRYGDYLPVLRSLNADIVRGDRNA
jgi:predicted nucleotidyltransferase